MVERAEDCSDPAAARTMRGRMMVMFGYSLNYLIDMKTAVIAPRPGDMACMSLPPTPDLSRRMSGIDLLTSGLPSDSDVPGSPG